ncbi:hypothetical protein ABR965_04065, partial [Photorhabdus laumondii]|uniref:hypothetical protein n=1 Tax=Photorhabdus laumondii TaxID=2218628 RepID=UPI003315516E
PNALIEEPKESNIRKGKMKKYSIYNNYFMKAIHFNEFLTFIRIIIIPLSKYRLFIFPLILDVQIEKIGLSSIQIIY